MMNASQLATLRADILSRSGAGGALESLWAQGADGAIAEWYNQPAVTGEFVTPLALWKPNVSIREINSAIAWTQKPAGADVATQTLNCLIWQNMIWSDEIDMTDVQVRQGIADIWGAGSTNDTNLRTVGKRGGTRFELVFAGAAVGGARVSPLFAMTCNGDDIAAVRASGG